MSSGFTSTGASIEKMVTLTTFSGVYNLTAKSNTYIQLLGSIGSMTISLPDARTLIEGIHYLFSNKASSAVDIVYNNSSLAKTIQPSNALELHLINNDTQGGDWDLISHGEDSLATIKFNDGSGTLTVGDVIYVKANNNIDAANGQIVNFNFYPIGIVLQAVIVPGTQGYVLLKEGVPLSYYTGLSIGPVYVHPTSFGDITQDLNLFNNGDYLYQVGLAISPDILMFDPLFIIQL